MDRALAVCYPASDSRFGERVRLVVAQDRWDLCSAEGMSLLEVLLRHTYPDATVRASGATLGGGRHRTIRVDVYRDGYPSVSARATTAARDGEPELAYQAALYLEDRQVEPEPEDPEVRESTMTT